eukprot:TRINITY_DN16862_c0_g1_i1.p1 TRINITY_DN16862_c0_g1~~TRINITY_DN16862_c0_g1_i1.p1  ORF type:complete len:241 (-),score=67.02 TRINITY_DN16862_c0_g1_i1:110-787(-)
MAEVERPWKPEEVTQEAVTKKMLVEFLQAKASTEFLKSQKLFGNAATLIKNGKKDQLVKSYDLLFESKAFRNEEEEAKLAAELEKTKAANAKEEEEAKPKSAPKEAVAAAEPPKYKKTIIKAGDKTTFPKKGDKVSCRYKGTLDDGKVFDQNMEPVKNKLPNPLSFKVGTGKVIRGWDEGLMTMSKGEKAKLVIEPEWAYGKNGIPGAIPPHARLTFEIELVDIE